MINLQDLSKTYREAYGTIQVLDRITFTIKKGEFIAVMGASGSGKSTLLNILGCLDTPSTGIYEFHGQDVARMSQRQLAVLRNQQIGFIFQNFQLLPRETVYANVELPLLYSRVAARFHKAKVLRALEQVGMCERASSFPTNISGGQKQKVAIARAIVNDPSLLLADEPTGNLDESSTEEVLKIFHELHQKGTTILMVTHDPVVARHAERVITIRKGQVIDNV